MRSDPRSTRASGAAGRAGLAFRDGWVGQALRARDGRVDCNRLRLEPQARHRSGRQGRATARHRADRRRDRRAERSAPSCTWTGSGARRSAPSSTKRSAGAPGGKAPASIRSATSSASSPRRRPSSTPSAASGSPRSNIPLSKLKSGIDLMFRSKRLKGGWIEGARMPEAHDRAERRLDAPRRPGRAALGGASCRRIARSDRSALHRERRASPIRSAPRRAMLSRSIPRRRCTTGNTRRSTSPRPRARASRRSARTSTAAPRSGSTR